MASVRERKRKWARKESADARNIWPIPPVKNAARRERCRHSLRLFCDNYNPEAFYLPWCKELIDAAERIEEAAWHGALYAFAIARGSGKTTLCRMAALWVVSYRIRRYPFILGATNPKAAESLDAIKTYMRFLPRYVEDFPEIAYPIRRLEGIAQRARGQVCGRPGEEARQTLIEWSEHRVMLPTVPIPRLWRQQWGRNADGTVPSSGSVISAAGLSAEGIRGSVVTLPSGESLRPDFVLLDDPQTPESARSPSQNREREQLIAADVLGMAGPDKSISAVMPCTVIAPGDMVDVLLDPERHPAWRGERTSLLRSMPKNLDAWERYREVWARCQAKRPPDLTEANDYYRTHRAELEEGAEPSWPERKLATEVSAVQHAMHLYLRDKTAFFSEYQNKPLPLVAPQPNELSGEAIARRLNQHARAVAPSWANRLTAFIDCHQDLLYWTACAWGDGFAGAVIDYGTWPDQQRDYFTLSDARPTLGHATGLGSVEAALWAGLDRLTAAILSRDWQTDGGGSMRVERCLIDCGWGEQTETVKRFCRQSPFATVLYASKGFGISAGKAPMDEWGRVEGERRGNNWRLRPPKSGGGRMVIFDSNYWKSFVASRLRQPLGEKGALTLFGADATAHRCFIDHLTAEYPVATKRVETGRQVDQWNLRVGRDNHWLDALVGCAVAASIQGAELAGAGSTGSAERKRVSYRELQEKARAGR